MNTSGQRQPLDDAFVLGIYVREVEQQCIFALNAHEAVIACMSDIQQTPDARSRRGLIEGLFGSLQALLVAGSCVSQLLWGSRTTEEARQPLRDALGAGDSSPLRSRDLRHDFVHVDDRLDSWARSAHHVFVDCNIGPRGAIVVEGPTQSYFRNFDPQTWTLTFQDKDYPLKTIVDELTSLEGTAAAWRASHGH